MENKDIKIVVSGDICVNLLQWITHPQNNSGLNWQAYPSMHSTLKKGAGLLLSKFISLSTGASIFSPQLHDVELILPGEFLNSTLELELFPMLNKDDKKKVYRVSRFMGFTGPVSSIPKLLHIIEDDSNADIIVLDDEDNGFNASKEFWPLALKSNNKSTIILYKTNNPIHSNELWNHLQKNHNENTIVIINSDDLRSKGVNISKSLSWEKTAQDFIWQINNNPNLAFLANCHHLIIPFGLEGAIYYRNDGVLETRLYFLPYEFEGGFIKEDQGEMFGLTSCFVAGLASAIVLGKQKNDDINESISAGIRKGISAAQKYFINGFGEKPENSDFPSASIFMEEEGDFIKEEHVQDVVVPNKTNPNCRSCWYILKDKSSTNIAEIGYDIVKNGVKKVLNTIPIAKFGNLTTVDKAEIESYRSIKNLMVEYISTKNTVRPLSIAVFGTPGSGKSFGIVEIANSIASDLIKKLDFNLSQFNSSLDLANAFHKIRDVVLEGKMPLVFFDEFDSTLDGRLGWLKYFLAPMQDGVFRQGDSTHPIGKAIFVFAGGTSNTFSKFSGEDIKSEDEQNKFLTEFKNAKGPDFISRLRGYVNILGPNQTEENSDYLFIIRRAMLLRSLLERKVPHLINECGEAQIDNGVLRALLKIKKYKHESRSMEAILEMSMLTNASKWEQSHLPSKEQLKLHVDEEQFLRHLMHDAFYSEKIEEIAKAIYERYITINKENINVNVMMSWNELSEEIKNYYREQVKHIPNSLLKINYDVVSVNERIEILHFTQKEIELLAESEYEYLYKYRKKIGLKFNLAKSRKKGDVEQKDFNKLPQEDKNKAYEMIKFWPEILTKSNFKIERLKFLCYCETKL